MREQYDRQAKFTDQYLKSKYGRGWLGKAEAEKVELTKEYVLALHREVDEILDEVPWKGHRSYDESTPVKSNVGEEIADVIKYAMGLAWIWGFSYEQLVAEIEVKSDVVDDRWRQEHGAELGSSPIVLLDLDGVLNEYPAPFLQFVQKHQAAGLFPTMEAIERWPLVKANMKHLYRQSGIKRTLPAIDESRTAAQRLARAGYEIVILSQRPATLYKRIYGDTVYWLRTNGIPYRRLIFADKKDHRLLLAPYLGRIVFAVDDDPDVVDRLRDLGIKVYWLNEGGTKSMLDIPEVMECET